MNDDSRRLTDTVTVKCPQRLTHALDQAAQRECTTLSAYARRAFVERLRADGFDLAEVG